MTAIALDDPLYRYCPYPGMRPFEASDARYFCGRDRHIRGVLERLRNHCFVAVTGGSGSGKSSLVRAGVIPALKVNGLEQPGQVWIIAICRPGKKPLESLRNALLETLVPSAQADPELQQRLLEELEGWSDVSAFLDLYRDRLDVERESGEAAVPESSLFDDEEIAIRRQRASLLLLVDQFEEIFDEMVVTAGGTHRLVELIAPGSEAVVETRRAKRVFTVVTIRSENLRSLGAFPILPDLFNQTQYHLGPLAGAEIQEAIQTPALRFLSQMRRVECQSPLPRKIEIEPGLVESMVAGALGLQHDPDHLFLVQHASRAVWLQAAGRWRGSADLALTTRDFVELSRLPEEAARNPHAHSEICAAALKKALDLAADAAYQALGTHSRSGESAEQRLARRLFTLLAVKDDSNWPTRRETNRSEVLEVAAGEDPSLAREDALERVIAAFRDPHPFIREDRALPEEEPTLYVAHEALIRNWSKFGQWLDEEHQARLDLKEITKSCLEWQAARASKAAWKWWRGSSELLNRRKLEQHRAWAEYRKNRAWHDAQLRHDSWRPVLPEAGRALTATDLQRNLDRFWRTSEQHDRLQRWGLPALVVFLATALPAGLWYIQAMQDHNAKLETTNQLAQLQSIASEIAFVGFEIAEAEGAQRRLDDNVRLYEAAAMLRVADKLRAQQRAFEEKNRSEQIIQKFQFDDLSKSVIVAERVTFAAAVAAMSSRVNWSRSIGPARFDDSRDICGKPKEAEQTLLAEKNIQVLDQRFKLVAIKETPNPAASNRTVELSPTVRFGIVDASGRCTLSENGFQLPSLPGADVRFGAQMEAATISVALPGGKSGHLYQRVRWTPVCRGEGPGSCADPWVEIWTEQLSENLVESGEVGVPWLPSTHLFAWSADRPTIANTENHFVDLEKHGSRAECRTPKDSPTTTCIIGDGGDGYFVRLTTSPTREKRRQHRVEILRRVDYDPVAEVEVVSQDFQAPEVAGVWFDAQRPEELIFKLKHGLGWLRFDLNRERMREKACEEIDALDTAAVHLASFEDFRRRRDEWVGPENDEPCL